MDNKSKIIGLGVIILLFIYSYFCFFTPNKIMWSVTNPMNNRSNPKALIMHGVIALIIALSGLIFIVNDCYN